MSADELLPTYQFVERHQRRCQPAAAALLAAIPRIEEQRLPVLRQAMWLRELPARLLGRTALQDKPPFGLHEFTLLQQDETSLIYALRGRFWQSDFGLQPLSGIDDFVGRREEAGAANLLLGFRVRDEGDSRLLQTETRVYCPDRASLYRFAPYWYLIRPVSGLIRRLILAEAERLAS